MFVANLDGVYVIILLRSLLTSARSIQNISLYQLTSNVVNWALFVYSSSRTAAVESFLKYIFDMFSVVVNQTVLFIILPMSPYYYQNTQIFSGHFSVLPVSQPTQCTSQTIVT